MRPQSWTVAFQEEYPSYWSKGNCHLLLTTLMVMPTPASIHKAPFIWRKNYRLETALLDSSSESGSIFSSSRKSLLPLNRMKNAGAFANLRIISRLITLTFFCLEVLLKFRWTKEIFKILKRKKGGGGAAGEESMLFEVVLTLKRWCKLILAQSQWQWALGGLFSWNHFFYWIIFGFDHIFLCLAMMKIHHQCLRWKGYHPV